MFLNSLGKLLMNDPCQVIQDLQVHTDDLLQVDWACILHDCHNNVPIKWLGQVNAARNALAPGADRSATMHRLQGLFGSRQRLMQIARMFPRSMVEYFASYAFSDISTAKANHFLGVVTNALPGCFDFIAASNLPRKPLRTKS